MKFGEVELRKRYLGEIVKKLGGVVVYINADGVFFFNVYLNNTIQK